MTPLPHQEASRRRTGASTLIVVLVIVTVLSLVAASLLEIISQEFTLSKRSLAWNQALFTAESGIELGWNEMNKLTPVNTNATFMSGWTYLGTNTWSLANQTLPPLAGIEVATTLTVSVQTNSPSASYATITASGTATSPRIANSVTRTVQVAVRPVTPFSKAMLAEGLINFNGNAATMDSYNSASGSYSTSTRRAHGGIGTDGLLINAAGLDLYGSAITGPGGSITTAAGFNLFQPVSPDTGTNTLSDGLRVSIPSVVLPAGLTTSSPALPGTSTITVSGAQQYYTPSLSLTGSSSIEIKGSGLVQIYVGGNLSTGGSAKISIEPTSPGSLQVQFYVGGTVSLLGNGLANTDRPGDLFLYGLPTCSSVTIGGGYTFQGSVYAPDATITLNGNSTVQGSIVAHTINAVGSIQFHYDEQLVNAGITLYYTTATWKEL